MRKLVFFSAFIFLFSSFSTTFFQSDSEKLKGEWRFQEVKYFKPFSFKSIDETESYHSFRLIFEDNNSVTYYNVENQLTYQGKWQILSVPDYTNDNTTNETKTLQINLKSETPGVADTSFQIDKFSLTKTKIYGTSMVAKNNYTLRLVKVMPEK
jgi:hypothetical protein